MLEYKNTNTECRINEVQFNELSLKPERIRENRVIIYNDEHWVHRNGIYHKLNGIICQLNLIEYWNDISKCY